MKLSNEQVKVLSAMQPGIQYGARDLKCRHTTLNSLAVMGLVAESIPHQLLAFFTSAPYKRRFKITDTGVKHVARTINNMDEQNIEPAYERQEVKA